MAVSAEDVATPANSYKPVSYTHLESLRLNRKIAVETGSLEYSRGGRNSWCSGEMLNLAGKSNS